MPIVTTRDVVERFNLQVVSGHDGLGRYIATSDLSRPGLEMAGYFMHYPADRVQLLGKTEVSFFEMLDESVKKERMLKLCSPDTPATRKKINSVPGKPGQLLSNNSNVSIERNGLKEFLICKSYIFLLSRILAIRIFINYIQ